MAEKIDFDAVNARVLPHLRELLPIWLPLGRFRGNEFVIGSIKGELGESCSLNWKSGIGKDFNSGEAFGDPVAMYAGVKGLSQLDAAKELAAQYGNGSASHYAADSRGTVSQAVQSPADAPLPPAHSTHGKPSGLWAYYLSGTGGPIMYQARYDVDGKKTFSYWTWRGSKWQPKSYPAPRPLYRLRELLATLSATVLVVEGEKAADAAVVGLSTSNAAPHAVVTWSGGAQATKQTDWSPLAGRTVVLWPDADKPGREAMATIAADLLKRDCKVSVVDVEGRPEGWDAADAVSEGEYIATIIANAVPIQRDPPKRITRAQPQQAQGATVNAEGVVEDDGSAYVWWDRLALERTGSQLPYTNASNVMRVLTGHPKFANKIWFDNFHERIFYHPEGENRREWSDTDDARTMVWIQRTLNMPKLGIEAVRQAVQVVSESHIRNEPQEWLSSLKWDGTDRLVDLMSKGFGAGISPYAAVVGRCWLVGLVARIFRPGAKVDALPVFEGKEELGKSSALAILGSPWFAECHESITTKDFYQSIQGKALVEISELHAFRKADIDRLKGVISCQIDRYRAPYGRRSEDHPRTCVFAGTTNRDNWNASDTGARRFWPIRCTNIDLKWLEDSKTALFAEAVARFQRGEIWWDVPKTDAQAEQESRRDRDSWEEVISKFITHRRRKERDGDRYWEPRETPLSEMTVSQILGDALLLEDGRWTRGDQMRVASALHALKWERKRRTDGWKYFPIENQEKSDDE